MSIDDKDPALWARPTMVRWFSPTLLANAAVRAFFSPMFGTYADARMTQATVDGFEKTDIEEAIARHRFGVREVAGADGAVWVDYVADTGDGFDSVYAIASLVAADEVKVRRKGSQETHRLPAGRLLILGGDQVYPYPSRDEYESRFTQPYKMAFAPPAAARKAFVIPGNHDWYDGLNSFDFLFCQARYGYTGTDIGGLQFRQHRSYFAIRLPYNWWIWGVDCQFSQYLDAGQVRYFQAVAEEMKRRTPGEPAHKVILCTAEPGWQYEAEVAKAANSNLEIITDIAANQGGADIRAVLSGDSHHYCRYLEPEQKLNFFTAGGGGAFQHPTHQLKSEVAFNWLGKPRKLHLRCKPLVDGTGNQPATFPSRMTSFWLTWMNWLFPLMNPTFAFLFGIFYWIMTWMYSQTQVARDSCIIKGWPEARPLIEDILIYAKDTCGIKADSTWGYLNELVIVSVKAGIHNFTLGFAGLLFLAVLVAYADARHRWRRILMGSAHWIAHLTASVALYLAINNWGYWHWFGPATVDFASRSLNIGDDRVLALKTIAFVAQMIIGGAIVGGTVWGGYLFFFCAFGRRHWNDAFSSLRLMNYKNFLRMRLEPDRLTIYPIGLRRAPTRVEWRMNNGRYEPRTPMQPELIDGPVVIDATNPERPQPPIT